MYSSNLQEQSISPLSLNSWSKIIYPWLTDAKTNNSVLLNSSLKAKRTCGDVEPTNIVRMLSGEKCLNYLNITKFMKLPFDFTHFHSSEDSGFVFDKVRINNRTFYGNGHFISK